MHLTKKQAKYLMIRSTPSPLAICYIDTKTSDGELYRVVVASFYLN